MSCISRGLARLSFVGAIACWASAQEYVIHDIGKLPDAHVTVPFAVNNDNEAVGWCQGPGSMVRPFFWRPGEVISELPLPEGFNEGYATDISHTGIIVGTAKVSLPANESRAWRMAGGVQELLPPFPSECFGMIPTAVNDFGDMIGFTCPDGGGPSNPWYFSDETGLIDLLPFGIFSAGDISNVGIVTGEGENGAFRWQAPAGPIEYLPPLPPPHEDSGVGTAINESNQVAGFGVYVITGPNHWRAFRFTDDEGTAPLTDYPGPVRTAARAINEAGDVVGNSGTEGSPDATAWFWNEETGQVFLSQLVDAPQFYGFYSAADINDQGAILAKAHSDQEYGHAVLLVPVSQGDVDGDGDVDQSDLGALLAAFNTCVGDAGFFEGADLDDSGCIDQADLGILLAVY